MDKLLERIDGIIRDIFCDFCIIGLKNIKSNHNLKLELHLRQLHLGFKTDIADTFFIVEKLVNKTGTRLFQKDPISCVICSTNIEKIKKDIPSRILVSSNKPRFEIYFDKSKDRSNYLHSVLLHCDDGLDLLQFFFMV